jgi:hypothetical protein
MTSDLTLKSPSESKLPEGWHNTSRHGEVYVSPGGTAWVVRQVGNGLKSVSVHVTPADIVKTPSVERVKHATAARKRYQVRVSARKAPNFGTGNGEGTKQGVLTA